MNWLIWKQHRKQFLILGILLALYAGLAIPMSLHLWHTYQYALSTCKKAADCNQLSSELFHSGWAFTLNPNMGGTNFLDALILAVPIVLGMFFGVPLIAREYSNKTNLLIWTRSVSRRKWLSTKLAWIFTATVLFASIVTLLTTWWARTGNALNQDRFSTVMFSIQGIVPLGYAVLAVAIGIALGAWLKRTLVAVGLTLVLMVIVQVVVGNLVRPHYMPAMGKSIFTNQLGPDLAAIGNPPNEMIVSAQIENGTGQLLNWSSPPKACIVPQSELPGVLAAGAGSHRSVGIHAPGNIGSVISINGGPAVSGNCLESQGYHYAVKYQPAYRYWDFQRTELALYLVLSLIPIGATYLLVLRRDA